MKLPDEVRSWLARRYANQHRDWLVAAGADPQWPLSVALGMPTEAAALRQPDAVRAWANAWRAWRGAGEVGWVERRWKVLGAQSLPDMLLLRDPEQLALWIGEQDRWRRATQRFGVLSARWPAAAPRLARLYDVLADYGESDFQRLLDLLDWLQAHPQSQLYPRQLPVAGIDSKWLEPRKGVVAELVAARQGSDDSDFYRVCGLRRPPAMLRLRVLDPALRALLGGLGDISAPLDALAQIAWQPSAVLIVENLQTGLALEDLPGTVAFMGLGYGVDALAALPWIKPAACLYWGDIDTHGYAILHRARACFPQLCSVMMDQATLLRYPTLWTVEKSQHAAADLSLLTDEERTTYRLLQENTHGQALRLEQERIAWDHAWPTLQAALRGQIPWGLSPV